MTTPLDTDTRLLVHAYADGELDPAHALSVKRQIDADPALATELASIMALQKALREHLPVEPAPAHLRSRIQRATGQASGPVLARPRPTWTALAASVLLAAGLSGGSTWLALRGAVGDFTPQEVVDGHVRAMMAAKLTDVVSSDSHTVKPWFNGRIPQAPRVVDLASDGFPLAGGRIDVIGATPVATLVYNRRLHVISLTALPRHGAESAPSAQQATKGYNLLSWSDGETVYWAASDLNGAELETFAKLFSPGPLTVTSEPNGARIRLMARTRCAWPAKSAILARITGGEPMMIVKLRLTRGTALAALVWGAVALVGGLAPAAAQEPAAPAAVAACPANFTALRGQADEIACGCAASAATGAVWGTDIYTDDSSICAAARHAGTIGQNGGMVTLRAAPGRDGYAGSPRNGVTSQTWARFEGSFVFTSPVVVAQESGTAGACPASFSGLRGEPTRSPVAARRRPRPDRSGEPTSTRTIPRSAPPPGMPA